MMRATASPRCSTDLVSSIFLIGMTGIGKTSTGQFLGQLLGIPFFDSDHEISALSGSSVAQLYATRGETFFRRLECGVIAELSDRKGIVLACGGGAILCKTVRELLRARGFVIYLRGNVETLQSRVEKQSARPILESSDLAELLRVRQQEREGMYEEVGHAAIECDGLSTKDVGLQVAALVRRFKASAEI